MLKRFDFWMMTFSFIALFGLFYLFCSNSLFFRADENASGQYQETAVEQPDAEQGENPAAADLAKDSENKYILLTGTGEPGSMFQEIAGYLEYMKKQYRVVSTLEEIGRNAESEATVTIVLTDDMSSVGDTGLFADYADGGMDFLFACMPTGESMDDACRDFTGVISYGAMSEIQGYIVMEGFFAEDPFLQDECETAVVDVRLSGRCRVYINEYASDKEVTDLIPLMWRTYCGEGKIFVMNNSFLEEGDAMGLFAMTLAQYEDVFAYPVINAGIFALDGVPMAAAQYDESCGLLYERTGEETLRDLVWPELISVSANYGIPLTFPDNSKSAAKSGNLDFYLSQIDRYQFELKAEDSDYIVDEDGISAIPSFSEEGKVVLPVTQDLDSSDQAVHWRAVNAAFGAGYFSAYNDISKALAVQNDADEWVSFSKRMGDNLFRTNRYLEWMGKMTASDAAKRAADYLLLEPVITKDENSVFIRCNNFGGEACFMVISKQPLLESENCVTEHLFGDVYLVTVENSAVEIRLGDGVNGL